MDYPFYLRELCRLPAMLHMECLDMLENASAVRHPHFTDAAKNPNSYRVDEEVAKQVVVKIATFMAELVLPGVELYWNEVNLLAPQGRLGEHSDLAYAGYNREVGNPQEVVLTHKIHIHLKGESVLSFRRSKHEPQQEFRPEPGVAYWYNNYVWHESFNPSENENRIALSLIYHDRRWLVRQALFDKIGLKYNDCYQL